MDSAAARIVRNDAPAMDLPAGDDQPELIVFKGVCGIAQRWFGFAIWVAVVMAHDDLPGIARFAMRAEQGGGIDFKGALGMSAGIFGRNHGFDATFTTQQKPAHFVRRSARSGGDKGLRDPACNCDNHPDIGYVMGAEKSIDVVLPADAAGWRLDRALAAALPQHSRERLKALVGGGRVSGATGVLWDPALKIKGGEALTLSIPEPRPSETVAQDIPLTIVYEDEALLVVDKPAGLVVHPAAGNYDGTMVNALLHRCAGRLSGIGGVARPGIVHRIDKDTSGLLVVAKTDPAHEFLSRQFAAHTVDRRYTAVVAGHPVPPAGKIEGALARSTANRQKMSIVPEGRGKRAVTHYRTIRALRHAAQVECRLETGRTHQIRVHMASIGHALLGDATYGRTPGSLSAVIKELGFERQALHAATLGFVHPLSQEKLSFESALPNDIVELISRLSVTAE